MRNQTKMPDDRIVTLVMLALGVGLLIASALIIIYLPILEVKEIVGVILLILIGFGLCVAASERKVDN